MITDNRFFFFAQTLLPPAGLICLFEHFEIFFLFFYSSTKVVWTDFLLKMKGLAPLPLNGFTPS